MTDDTMARPPEFRWARTLMVGGVLLSLFSSSLRMMLGHPAPLDVLAATGSACAVVWIGFGALPDARRRVPAVVALVAIAALAGVLAVFGWAHVVHPRAWGVGLLVAATVVNVVAMVATATVVHRTVLGQRL